MRVFVLGTGKCGTTTFAKACSWISNFTSAHESRCHLIQDRCVFPDGHIEVANRLAWFLGTLDRLYGDDPLYVHLTRDRHQIVRSMSLRWRGEGHLLPAMGRGLLQHSYPPGDDADWDALAGLCVDTIDDNIALFLRDKSTVVRASLPDLRAGFDEMWDRLGAEGDLDAAHDELAIRHNKRARRGGRR